MIKLVIFANNSQIFNFNQILYINLHLFANVSILCQQFALYYHKFQVYIEDILFWIVFPMELFETITSFELFD